MNIVKFIENDSVFKKYKDRYSSPMGKFVGNVPDRILKPFIKQATINEIVDCYMGFLSRKHWEIPAILTMLERSNQIKIPVIDGILTHEYWEHYYLNSGFIRIMELSLIN